MNITNAASMHDVEILAQDDENFVEAWYDVNDTDDDDTDEQTTQVGWSVQPLGDVAEQPERDPPSPSRRRTFPYTAVAVGSAEPSESALMSRVAKPQPKGHSPERSVRNSNNSDLRSKLARWSMPRISETPETDNMDDNGIFVSVDYAEGNINATEEEIEIHITLDSGAVDHVLATDHLPSSALLGEVSGTRVGKTFVAANGTAMQTFGECILECRDNDGTSCSSFAVTEVTRPLQSVSRMCDQGLEVLFTKTFAKVRDPKTGKFVATYPRRGGLYTRTAKVRGGAKPKDEGTRRASPFIRPSTKK